MIRGSRLAAAALAVALVLSAGCSGGTKSARREGPPPGGSSSTATTTPPTAPSAVVATAQGTACPTAALRLTYLNGNGAAGHSISTYEFTNTAAKSCTLSGYPGVSVLDSQGQVVPHPATRSPGPGTSNSLPALTVTVPGGGHATFVLSSTDNVPNPDCPRAYRGVTLRVYPPGNTVPIEQPFTGGFCDLVVGPVQPTEPGVVADCEAPGDESNAVTTEPSSIIIACADNGTWFQGLSWTSWNPSSATATGQVWEKNCVPNCIDGGLNHYDAAIALTGVISSMNGPVFSVATASYPHGGPSGASTGRFSLPVPPPRSPNCSAAQLRGTLIPPGTSGQFSEGYVQFTNVSSVTCHMEGFPGFDLLDSSGHTIVNAGRGCPWAGNGQCPATPQYINLPAHNGTAFFGYVWQSSGEGQACSQSASALITPPNAFDHLTLPVQITLCGRPPALGVGTMGYAI